MSKSLYVTPELNFKRLTLGRWFIGLVETYSGKGQPLSDVLRSKGYSFYGEPKVIDAISGSSYFFPCKRVKTLSQFWPSRRRKYRPYSCYEEQIVVITEDETWAGDELFCETFMPGFAGNWKTVAEKYGLITKTQGPTTPNHDVSVLYTHVEDEFFKQNRAWRPV